MSHLCEVHDELRTKHISSLWRLVKRGELRIRTKITYKHTETPAGRLLPQ